jgi:NAD(P)-dependent dehydrogenase (short-subunit alcohol dehydrogenase family)
VGDEGEDLVRITVRWAAGAPTGTGDFGVPAHRAAPAEPAGFADLAGTVGVGCDPVLLARLLPHLAAALPARHLALILATTYLVGMEAPGRHSLFTQLDLTFDPQPGHGDLAWQARRFDERFSLLTLGLEAGMRGASCALVRAAPVVQAGMEAIAAHVRPGAFAGQRALVVGGSRGLGEVAAKLLAAGGASLPDLSHRRGRGARGGGRDRPMERARGAGRAGGAVRCASPPAHDLAHDLATLAQWAPSHLYYFASPFIPDRAARPLFARSLRAVLRGLCGGVRHAGGGLARQPCRRVCPLVGPCRGAAATLREYAAAKAAAEFAGAHLLPAGLACTMPRLPVLLTDQTAALADGAMEEACAVLLAALSPSRTGRG